METEVYRENAKKVIDELFIRIDELDKNKENIRHLTAEKRDNLIEELKTRKAELQHKFEMLKQVPEERWDEAKTSFKASIDYFSEGVSRLANSN